MSTCWICGQAASTREHIIKASDIRQFFGPISQSEPVYYHFGSKRNFPVGSAKSNRLKFSPTLCNECNSARTRPHDLAWEALSSYLQKNWRSVKRSRRVDLSKPFPGLTKVSSLNTHLYFTKVFGCLIVEHDVPISVAPFAEAILNNTAHPHLYLAFGQTVGTVKHKLAAVTPINSINEGGHVVFANWSYIVGDVTVEVIYSEDESYLMAVKGCWHPTTATKLLTLSNFRGDYSFRYHLQKLGLVSKTASA